MYVKSYNQAHGTPTYLGASYRDDNTMCYVYGRSAGLASGDKDMTYGICPLVSLKSNFIPQISE